MTLKTQSKNLTFVIVEASDKVEWTIDFNEYDPKTVEDCYFVASCYFEVEETDQVFYTTDEFQLRKPDLTVEVHEIYFL